MSRKQLMEHALGRSTAMSNHLAECSECRQWLCLLKTYCMVDRSPLMDAPKSWIKKAVALAENSGSIKNRIVRVAQQIFDSWAIPIPVGVRGEKLFDDRRIRFESDGLIFDLQAIFRKNQWGFVARILGDTEPTTVLKVDKAVIGADSTGFYQWSGKLPPKKMSLLSNKFHIKLPELKWAKPKLK
ncbi:MAG: hypothetical protein ABIJ45_00320 [Candidatus Zixiibacteriota bacterium]